VSVLATHLMHGSARAVLRGKQLREAIRAFENLEPPSAGVLVLGDMNMRPEEEKNLVQAVGPGAKDAPYSDCSWDPMRNRFFADKKGTQSFAFDRIFFGGCVFVRPCLVGHARCHAGTVRFCLSDHYAVRAVVDFFDDAGGADGRRSNVRRAHVGRVVGDFVRAEMAFVLEVERCARQGYITKLAKLSDLERAQTAKQRQVIDDRLQARRAMRKKLWDDTFGSDSLFAFKLGSGDVFDLQAVLDRCSLHRPPDPMGSVALPQLGFVNGGNTCYISSVAQLLLRVPAVARFLVEHSRVCGVAIDGPAITDSTSDVSCEAMSGNVDVAACVAGDSCVICSLWSSRRRLGSVRALPFIAEQRGLVGLQFNGCDQHDAAEFLMACLGHFRRVERLAGRRAPLDVDLNFADADSCVTGSEHLFLLLEEQRRLCRTCGLSWVNLAPQSVLGLPLPSGNCAK
jgi:hypothetical protein